MSTCPYCHYWSAGWQTRLPDWYIEAEAYRCCLRASAAEIRRVFNTKYGPTNSYISAGYINLDCLIGILKRELHPDMQPSLSWRAASQCIDSALWQWHCGVP